MSPILFGVSAGVVIIGAILLTWWRDEVRVAEGRRLMRWGATLVDVDEIEDFEREHVDGAKNIPLTQLAQRADELGPLDVPIVVYGRGRLRGARATHELRKLGYHQVFNMGGFRQ